MVENLQPNEQADEGFDHRRITLSDGRYMIFYTFDEVECEEGKEDDQGEDV